MEAGGSPNGTCGVVKIPGPENCTAAARFARLYWDLSLGGVPLMLVSVSVDGWMDSFTQPIGLHMQNANFEC